MLSCSCPSDEYDSNIIYYVPNDYSVLNTSKRKRCVSCKCLIDRQSTCTIFDIKRLPKNEIEERIYGEGHDVPMASRYMCENCSDIFFNLYELGFCVSIEDNMNDLLEEYKLSIKKKD